MCIAVALGSVGATAQASTVNVMAVPVRPPIAPGVSAKPLAGAQSRLVAGKSVTVLSMMPITSPEQGAARLAPSYDLRLAREYQSGALSTIKQNLRARGSGMHDAYLHGGSGLRASVGSSYHMQYRASDAGPGAAAGRAALMRLPVGAVNLRDGFESYAPVAMVGYDATVTDRMKVGVEGGMMVGRSTAMYADETIPETRDMSHGTHNPVADVVMTYAF